MSTWFYIHNGQQLGPVGFEVVRRLAANGELNADDQVWEEGTPAWIVAANVPGLFARQTPPANFAPAVVGRKSAAGSKGKISLVASVIVVGITIVGLLYVTSIYHPVLTPPVSKPAAKNEDNLPPLSGDTDALATRILTAGMKSIRGDGVPQDTAKGLQLLKQASQLGNGQAAYTLGKMYADGQGVEKNDKEAVRYFSRGAEKGNAEAIAALAAMKKADGESK